jgi:glycine/D-amino acid oxidase-like deaminating enzyme
VIGEHIAIVGGGLLGAAIAYGAIRSGLEVTLFDEHDTAHRASRGNFGLAWIQGKGLNKPEYVNWTKNGLRLWPELQEELLQITGIDVALQQPGGFWLGFSDREVLERETKLKQINAQGVHVPYTIMDRSDLLQYLPELGPSVVGGSFCSLDGQANPLLLLKALHSALKIKGANIINGVRIERVTYDKNTRRFLCFNSAGDHWESDRLVLAAGLGNAKLAADVDIYAPIRPKRGQILITEKLKPFLNYPTNKCRQTNEGSIQIGSTSDDVGLDDSTKTDQIELLARRAVKTFPLLSDARLVRAWGALRPLTPDGYPIYQESVKYPGAFVVTSHSGVTLAAAHCYTVAPWISGLTQTPLEFIAFRGDRFIQRPKE